MSQKNSNSYPPKKIPALEIVPTEEFLVINGKRFRVMKIERAARYK